MKINMKKIKIVLCASMMLAGTLAVSACGKKETITMGTNAEFPPFEYVTENGLVGNIDGVDVAIAMEIAKSLNKELKVENMEFKSVLVAVASGNVDMGIAGMTVSPDRLESMDFSTPYYTATQYIIVKSDNSSINSAADLIDKKVGAIDGYTGFNNCVDLGVADLTGFVKGVDALNELDQNKLDAVVIDSHTALAMTKNKSQFKLIEDPSVFETEEYAIAVKKGNTALLESINKVVEKLLADGKIDEYVADYTSKLDAAANE